ncbi:MAG: glycosyltransferase family 2 protein [Candidatus Omnitrophica bacterium]|nr:glycosyltransferase family 2 protein [Candidatus Omnitrophota bacterium]
MRQKISVVILTRNEESFLKQCLDSVKWADEIVIIDDNSTDRTREIAAEYTDKIVTHPMNRDFVAQRNLGIKHTSGDWILEMDSDEKMTEGLKKDILNLLERGSEFSAFRFRRANNFCGKFLRHGGEEANRPLRLFKSGRGKFEGSGIDDFLVIDGGIGDFDSVMEHYNYPCISHYLTMQDFYSSLEAEEMVKKFGLIPKKRLKRELLLGPVKLFIKIYIKKAGYKDGIHGLVFAILSSFRRFLRYAKYWELNKEAYK